jgi:hypothetical protein
VCLRSSSCIIDLNLDISYKIMDIGMIVWTDTHPAG